MAWPTTNISTQNLDQGTDSPALARVDIKNMADSVNAMTNSITDSGVSNNDILKYSTAQSKFIPAPITDIAPNLNPAQIVLMPTNTTTASAFGQAPGAGDWQFPMLLTELSDPNNLFSQDASGVCTFASGTYVIVWPPFEYNRRLSYIFPVDGSNNLVSTVNSIGTDIASDGYVLLTPSPNTSGQVSVFDESDEMRFNTTSYTKWMWTYQSGGQNTPPQSTAMMRGQPIVFYKVA